MLIEKTAFRQPVAPDVRAWRSGQTAMPSWVKAAADEQCANGTFMLRTPRGAVRVHRGQVVVEQAEDLYVCDVDELEEQVRVRTAAVSTSASPKALVGPGKRLPAVSARRRYRAAASQLPRRYAPQRGQPPSIEWVGVGDLKIDQSYQRSIDTDTSRRLVATIAARWDWRLCMPLAVSRREDARYVIDGQHRHAAALLRGDIPHLPCCIANYDTVADEAAIFVVANRARRAINRLDDFHAALVAGDEDANEVRDVIQRAGFTVARRTGSQSWLPGEVAFTNSIQTVLGRHGEQVVLPALKALAVAFPGEVLHQGASLFLGLTRIMISPPDKLDVARLNRALQSRSMAEWGRVVRQIKGGDVRAQAVRQALLDAYAALPI